MKDAVVKAARRLRDVPVMHRVPRHVNVAERTRAPGRSGHSTLPRPDPLMGSYCRQPAGRRAACHGRRCTRVRRGEVRAGTATGRPWPAETDLHADEAIAVLEHAEACAGGRADRATSTGRGRTCGRPTIVADAAPQWETRAVRHVRDRQPYDYDPVWAKVIELWMPSPPTPPASVQRCVRCPTSCSPDRALRGPCGVAGEATLPRRRTGCSPACVTRSKAACGGACRSTSARHQLEKRVGAVIAGLIRQPRPVSR